MKNITYYVNLGNIESDRYRVFNIIEALVRRGVNCRLLSLLSTEEDIQNTLKTTDLTIFFRCEMNPKVAHILNECKKNNVPTVFDVDDLIFDTDIEQLDNDDKILRAENLMKTLDKCDYFTCSTQTLKQCAEKHGKKSFVIPNTINYKQFEFSKRLNSEKNPEKNRIKIGYFSGSKTHNQDFKQCESPISSVLDKYHNVELHIIGHLELAESIKKHAERIITHPFMNYLAMLEYMSGMDINIAPLELNVFNDAKSELKIFEAGIVLVPTIASSTESYKNIITDGVNGFLAENEHEWEKKLTLLIENPSLRQKLALSASEKATQDFYIDNCIDKIISIYDEIAGTSKYISSSPPKEAYIGLCDSLNLKYSDNELDNQDFLSLLYKEGSSFTGFNSIVASHMGTQRFNDRVSAFVSHNKDKKICFWGAGGFFKEILKNADLSELNIVGIIDKAPTIELFADRYKVFPPTSLNQLKPDLIIITALLSSLVEPSVREFLRINDLHPETANIIDLLFAEK